MAMDWGVVDDAKLKVDACKSVRCKRQKPSVIVTPLFSLSSLLLFFSLLVCLKNLNKETAGDDGEC